MSRKGILLTFFIFAPLFAALMVGVKVYYDIFLWHYPGEEKIFTIAPGENFARINWRLERGGFIADARLFYRYSQFKGLTTKFRTGSYRIVPGINMADVTILLTSGEAMSTEVTIPEGKNLYEIARILEEGGIIKDAQSFVSLCAEPSFLKAKGLKGKNCEGYLYPDTYRFSPATPAGDAIGRLYEVFKMKTRHLDFSHTLLDPHEVIILASIVEKETGAPWERPLIAGVFHNRLNKGMRLQSDPTTIYGIWDRYKGNLRRSDLLEKTPYNTYKISGLPAGPIANPGLASIEAVLSPKRHSFLYFVSKNDGTHVFSATYKQHNQAVQRYQKSRAARRGKSWRDLKASKK